MRDFAFRPRHGSGNGAAHLGQIKPGPALGAAVQHRRRGRRGAQPRPRLDICQKNRTTRAGSRHRFKGQAKVRRAGARRRRGGAGAAAAADRGHRGRWRLRRLRKLFLAGRGNGRCRIFRRADLRQGRADRQGLARFGQQGTDLACLEDLDFDGALLGLNHRHNIAFGHVIAGLDQPFDQLAFLHVGTERGHGEKAHAVIPGSAFTAAMMSATCGRAAVSRCLG